MSETQYTTPEQREWEKTDGSTETYSNLDVVEYHTTEDESGELQTVRVVVHNESHATDYVVAYSCRGGTLKGVKEVSWYSGDRVSINQTTLRALGYAHERLSAHFDVDLDDPIDYILDDA